MKRYPRDIFLCPGISRLSLGCRGHEPWINLVYPMSNHLLFIQMQPAVQNAARFSEKSAWMMHTSKLFNDLIKRKKLYCLLAPRLLFTGGEPEAISGGAGSPPSRPPGPPRQPPPPPWRGMAVAGVGRHHPAAIAAVAVQEEEAQCSDDIWVPLGPWRRSGNSNGSLATLLVVLEQYQFQAIIRM